MKTYKTELKWALIFFVMSLLWMLLEKLTGLHDAHIDKHSVYSNFIAIPAIGIYVLALLDKRKNHYGGAMTYGQGFLCGLVMTVIITVLSPLSQLITFKVITPGYFQHMIAYNVQVNALSQADAESYFTMRNYIIQGMIGALGMGIVTTAIVAVFTRKQAKRS